MGRRANGGHLTSPGLCYSATTLFLFACSALIASLHCTCQDFSGFSAPCAGTCFLELCRDTRLPRGRFSTAKKSASSQREIWNSDSAAPWFSVALACRLLWTG